MYWQRSDLYVGLVLLVVAGLVAVAILTTVPRFRARGQALSFRVERLYRLEEGAPVLLDGYPVGRVRSISPVAGSGDLEFRVTIAVRRRLPSGLRLELRQGTSAEISSETLFSAPVVMLRPSINPGAAVLAEGATIPARVGAVAAEALGRRVPELIDRLDTTLARLPGIMSQVAETFASTRTVSDTARALLAELHGTTAALARDAERVLGEAERSVRSLGELGTSANRGVDTLVQQALVAVDSMSLAIAGLSRLVQELRAMRADAEPSVVQILADLEEVTMILNNLVRSISERPLRVLTGVRVPRELVDTPSVPDSSL
nr:MCE family protein [Gemmatimonadota bacterium]